MTEATIEFLRRWGELDFHGAVALSLLMVAGALVPIPRTTLNIASGFIFGLASIPIIVPSMTLGAVIAFLLARHVFAERFQRMADRKPKLRTVLDAVDKEGWRVVALLRFFGPVPSVVQNYFYGLTRIGLFPFAAATFVFPIPQICLYVYLGSLGRTALEDIGTGPSLALGLIGALCLAAVLVLVGRRMRAALQAQR